MSALESRLIRGLDALSNNDAQLADALLREAARDPDDIDTPAAGLTPAAEARFHELRAALALEEDDLASADAALARAHTADPTRAAPALIEADHFTRDAGYHERAASIDDDGVLHVTESSGTHQRRASSALTRDDDHTLTYQEVDASLTTERYSYTAEGDDGQIIEVHCEREVEHIERIRRTTIVHDDVLPDAPEAFVITEVNHLHIEHDGESLDVVSVSVEETPSITALEAGDDDENDREEDANDREDEDDDWDEDEDDDWDEDEDDDWDEDE